MNVDSSNDTDYATDGRGLRSRPDKGTSAERVSELMRWENSFTKTLLRRLPTTCLPFLLLFVRFALYTPLLQRMVLDNMYIFWVHILGKLCWLLNSKHTARIRSSLLVLFFLLFSYNNYIRMWGGGDMSSYGAEF